MNVDVDFVVGGIDATCTIVSGLPDPALDALGRAFPGSRLVVGSSLLAQRPGRLGPDLASRTFRARAGSTGITVRISKPTAGTQPISTSERRFGRVRTITSLEQSVPGFVVAVDVSQPAGSWPIAYEYLVQLANDDGLVATS